MSRTALVSTAAVALTAGALLIGGQALAASPRPTTVSTPRATATPAPRVTVGSRTPTTEPTVVPVPARKARAIRAAAPFTG